MRSRIKSVLLAVLTLATISVFTSQAAVGAQATPKCNGNTATIVGTSGADTIFGTTGNDVIVGLGGADRIFGLAGNDIICGNAGPDLLQGGPGRDQLFGGVGNDEIIGGPGNDILRGGTGADELFGKAGNDDLRGEGGNDQMTGNLGIDTCTTVSTSDTFITGCERGNSVTKLGTGDGVARPVIPDALRVARYCFSPNNCDDYYAASVTLDGTGTFDALGIQAFDADGDLLATYAGVGDTYEGSFLFRGKPTRIEVDSGGGQWRITFVNKFGLPSKKARANGRGNMVYKISNPVKNFSNVSATWNGYGNFAVMGVSNTRGRDLMVNEVRFQGGDTPPFSATATAQSGISVVQVLSEGTWSVRLGS